ncbi:hypothetical protein niasHT_026323 [Heterodera trifolii]|uniref:Serpin domain-containing protein n=1 Tax=Heterodera trifolii TaxID=157864 RepID=A0ABD2K0F1_9BILA
MISGQSIDDQSLIFLINAIYFHAKWSQPFDQKDTGKRPFLLANGSENQVDMMSHMNQFIYNEQNNFKLLGKEFGGGNAHLFIVLPNSNDGLTKVLEELTEAKLMEMVKNSPVTKVMVSLPKFKIESTHNLEELLPSLGLKTAFDKENADFSGINDTVRLYISKVLQRAMISVNEQGVEAAAATMVIIATDISTAEIPPVFRANHPFAFFLVKNKKENTVLSPVSAAIALAMAYAGARGQTAAEFVNLLADGADGSSIHQNNAKFIEQIESEKTFNLSIANKIYLDENFTILEEFNQTLSNYYQGNFESIDFGNSEEAAKFKLLGMEFVGGNAHLFIVLPKSKDGLTKVLGEMTEAKLIRMIKKSPVIRVEVDEKGCEAAAATVINVIFIAPMDQKPPPPPPVFRADHPFAFFLVKSAKDVLFSGAFVGKE